ncbi:MAG: nucleotidyltransferase [Lachnospiraceae bacterium]|nr:nucleotidyltransferase [Lachnospiraceae bacterium]
MKTVGIIAEYNPFHNGHKYQIEKAKEVTGAERCIIIMSGDFVQRGTPAIMDKYLRTKAALMCGADLVIELPVHYATASAEYFASGSVALLDRLGVADCICFGSECGDIDILSGIADVLISESDEFKNVLKQRLKEGASYPKARNEAICAAAPHLAEHLDVLNHPNNILGIEYLKALKRRKSSIKPYTVSRIGAGYNDIDLAGAQNPMPSTCESNVYSSALAIRKSIMSKNDISVINEQVPNRVYGIMEETYLKTFPIFPEDISLLLHYKLLQEQDIGFERYFDIDTNFSDKIKKYLPNSLRHAGLCDVLKSKNMTYTRVARNLLHILLNIYQSDVDTYCLQDYVYYARMLGFRKEAADILSAIKEISSIPLISKLADAEDCIKSAAGIKMLQCDIQASHLYSMIVQHKFNCDFCNEYTEPIIIL